MKVGLQEVQLDGREVQVLLFVTTVAFAGPGSRPVDDHEATTWPNDARNLVEG